MVRRTRVDSIIDRLRHLEDAEVSSAIDDGRRRAKRRHRDIESIWIANGRLACDLSVDSCSGLDRTRLLLLGMAFTLEYAFEAAALTNPSMVALGDLTPEGEQEIVMSARAIGEGHISSITFRGGHVSPEGNVRFDRPSLWADNGERSIGPFDREKFRARMNELGVQNHLSEPRAQRPWAELQAPGTRGGSVSAGRQRRHGSDPIRDGTRYPLAGYIQLRGLIQ